MSATSFDLKRLLVERAYFPLRPVVGPVLDLGDRLYRGLRGRSRYPPLSHRQLVSGSFFASTADFDENGARGLSLLQRFAALERDEAILDVGCGCGRIALPLLDWLEPTARYAGGDVDARMIRWLEKNVAPQHPNATFFHIDVFNSYYSREAKVPASAYRFPFDDGAFDVVFLASVFTHMLPEGVANYLREIARLLSDRGRALLTLFIVDYEGHTESPAAIRRKFPYPQEGFLLASDKVPDLDTAYRWPTFRRLAGEAGLAARGPLYRGTWQGGPDADGAGYQDLLILERTPH